MLFRSDVVDEAHDTHHPITVAETFEAQRDASIEAARAFTGGRLAQRLDYFADVLAASPTGWLLGDGSPSYVDLALFQLVEGLKYAFPNAMGAVCPSRTDAHRRAVSEIDAIAEYLKSERRLAFNEHGIFRRYPELDRPNDGR